MLLLSHFQILERAYLSVGLKWQLTLPCQGVILVHICEKIIKSYDNSIFLSASDMMSYPGAPPSVISSQPAAANAQQVILFSKYISFFILFLKGYVGPAGLEYLAMVDHLLIKQQVDT